MKKKWKKLGIMALTMSLLLSGCSNGGTNSNDSNSSGGTSEFLTDSEVSAFEDTETAKEAFSGDWEAEEEYGYSPFWLKYADFGSMEEKDFSDVMFFNKFSFGTDLMGILSGYSSFDVFDAYGSGLLKQSSLEDILNYTKEMVSPNQYVHIYTSDMSLKVYNLTDSPITIKECIQNNQFILDSSEYGGFSTANKILGFDFTKEEFRAGMADVMGILGKPTQVYYRHNSSVNTDRSGEESFDDTVKIGGGWLIYQLLYDKGEYLLCIEISEDNYFGKYGGEADLVYITKDLYTYLNTTSSGYIVKEENVYEYR